MTAILATDDAWVIESFRAELSALPEVVEPHRGERHQLSPGVWILRTPELPPLFVFEWHAGARCAGAGWAKFFGRDDAPNQPSLSLRDLRAAQAVCRTCPQLRDCFVHSLTHDGKGESHGIWGGMSGRQRKPLLKELEKLDAAGRPAAVRRMTEEWLGTL